MLKDDGRRAEYEAFWARALGPFERTQVPGMAAFQVVSPTTTTTAPATVTEVTSEAAVDHATASPAQAAPESDLADITTGLRQVASLLHDWDQRAFPGEALDGPSGRVLRWASELRGTVGVVVDDLELRRADVDGLLAQFEVVRAQINQLAQLKHQFASDALGR